MADDAPKIADQDLYERDYLAWTEKQADLLRAGAAGLPYLDFENLIEEIESLGRSEAKAVGSHLDRILDHLLKIEFIGPREPVDHWRKEVRAFRYALEKDFTPSLRRRLKERLQDRYEVCAARMGVYASYAGRDASLPDACRYTWEQVLDPEFYPEPRYA